jgi:hypothetical protein
VALPLYNPAEGTSGASITTAPGASTSGDAMDTTSGTGITFDSVGAAHGATGWKFATAATVVAAYFGWTTSLGTLTTNQTMFVRIYFRSSVAAPTNSLRICQILNGTTVLASINHASGAGSVELRATGDVAVTNNHSVSSLAANTIYRIEVQFTGLGTTTGHGWLDVWQGDTATRSGTAVSNLAMSYGTLAPNTVRVGVCTGSAQPSSSIWIDDFALSATSMPAIPGGTAAKVNRPVMRSNTAVQRAALWMKKHNRIFVPKLWLPAGVEV